MAGIRTDSGKDLQREWGIPADHVLYHKDGNWYHVLDRFPGALADPTGYVLFNSESEFRSSPYLDIAEHVHVPSGIRNIPGYKRMK